MGFKPGDNVPEKIIVQDGHLVYAETLFESAEAELVRSEDYGLEFVCLYDEYDAACDAMADYGIHPGRELDYQQAFAKALRQRLIKTGKYALLAKRRADAADWSVDQQR